MGYEKKKTWKIQTEKFDDTVSYTNKNGKTVSYIKKPLSDEQIETLKKSGFGQRIPKEEVLRRCIEVHGNKYDYSLSEFGLSNTKIKIICPVHGIFERQQREHYLEKRGCPKCGNHLVRRKKTTEELITDFKKVHGDKYDYSLVEFMDYDQKIKIICPIHGEFEQLPLSHKKLGCGSCGHARKRVDVDIHQVKKLREQGLTRKEIAEKLGTTLGAVKRGLSKLSQSELRN